jgi:tetratricopeptide (TPR) repeat protein
VIYILESIFLGNVSSKYKSRLGQDLYYELFFLYARAISHTSRHISGTDFYKKIIKETAYNQNSRVMNVRAKALSEMVNSSFEHLHLKEVNEYTNELEPLLYILFKNGEIPEKQVEFNSSYILMREISMLGAMLLDRPEDGERAFRELEEICSHVSLIERRGVLRIRFARCIYHIDIHRAKILIKQGISDRLEGTGDTNDKWILIGTFELAFLSAVQGHGKISEASEAQEKLKSDLFNDYRRAMNAMAALHLVKRNMDNALEIFSREAEILRAANPRYSAIRLQLLAAYEFQRGNYQKSENHLREQYKLFNHIGDSYRRLIAHNIETVTKKYLSKNEIEFAIVSVLSKGIFYIDLRLW